MSYKVSVFIVLVLILTLLVLASCDAQTRSPSTSVNEFLLPMSTDVNGAEVCLACAQATLDAALIQQQSSADAQAIATAEVMRVNAQATLNSVSSTLGAAQAEELTKANLLAAQLAATADIIRANAQATMVAADSTQSSAQTQDAIRQTQAQFSLQVTADLATQNALATLTQQNNNLIAANTQTAVADLIATQTQSALATSQWSEDQARKSREQGLGQIAFMGMICLPILVILSIFGFWRWMNIRETQQIIDRQLAAPDAGFQPESSTGTRASFAPPIVIDHEPRTPSEVANNQYPPAKPTDPVPGWLEEVKEKIKTNKKDDDDDNDNADC